MRLIPSNLSNSSLNYEALSYVWGTEVAPRNLLLDDIPTTITSNLDIALRHLRGTIVTRTLWVDAVSMNQKDTQERNHQVQIMGKIYSSAREVIVWLGPVDLTDLNLRAVLGAMQFQFSSVNPSTSTLFDYIISVVSLMKEQIGMKELAEKDVIAAITSIITRPWFSRLWVVQELALSMKATIRIGTFTFPWQPFESFIQWIPEHKVDSSMDPGLAEAARSVAKMARSRSFSSQLLRTIHLKATDPRDKIFGILGVSSFRDVSIEADYTKSVQQTYIDAACLTLHDEKLAMYYYAPLQPYSSVHSVIPRKLFGVPSWVPDFSIEGATYVTDTRTASSAATHYGRADHRPFTILFGAQYNYHIERLFSAMILRLPFLPLKISLYKTRLHAPGILVGTIIKTSGHLLWNMDKAQSPSGLPQSVHDIYHSIAKPANVSPLEFVDNIIRPSSLIAPWEKYKIKAAAQLLTPMEQSADPSNKMHQAMKELIEDIKANAVNRIFYIADNGSMGLTYHPNPSDGVRPGDVVVGLFGINFPFILRPNSDVSYKMINVASATRHRWGHDFLKNTEDDLANELGSWMQGLRASRNMPTATWKDYEKYGMKEYVLV
ncbi:HET-domain-containing protein [Phaeosphaeriaceae sp. SRC1lsM3a]|nr:HET-domain-containing protein [Stagonospora sp. SRC1lsM3a]